MRAWGFQCEFPKIGDPNIVPYFVGSLLFGSQYRVTLFFGNSHVKISLDTVLNSKEWGHRTEVREASLSSLVEDLTGAPSVDTEALNSSLVIPLTQT